MKNSKGFSVVEGVLVVAVICLLFFIGWQIYSAQSKTKITNSLPDKSIANNIPAFVPNTPYSTGVKFRSTITVDECATSTLPIGDVGCSITVSPALQIEVKHGNMLPQHPWGTVSDAILTNNLVGKTVDVYAHQVTDKEFTLEGSSDFYVTVLN